MKERRKGDKERGRKERKDLIKKGVKYGGKEGINNYSRNKGRKEGTIEKKGK